MFFQMKFSLLFSLAVTSLVVADHPPANPLDENDVIDEEPNGVIDFSKAVPQKDGSMKYNRVVTVATLEACAGNLEAMRVKFLRLGGNQTDIYGAFQANFLFLVREGVLTSTSLEGPRYVALVRTGDGRLAIPGAMPQQ